MSQENLFTQRKGLYEICTVPDKIISVYSLEKHVWADSNSEASHKARKPELQTIEEFQIDPAAASASPSTVSGRRESRPKAARAPRASLLSSRRW